MTQFYSSFYNRAELVRLQGSASYKPSVDIGLLQEFFGIVRFH